MALLCVRHSDRSAAEFMGAQHLYLYKLHYHYLKLHSMRTCVENLIRKCGLSLLIRDSECQMEACI